VYYEAEHLQQALDLMQRTRTQYPWERVVSHTFPLERINEAFVEADAGRVPDTKILLLLDREADRFLAKRAAADAELVKPFDAGTLRRTMKRLLSADAPV